MNAVPDVRFSRVGKHLDVFEESWKADHNAAMALYDFQEVLAEGLGLYAWLKEESKAFRLSVFIGVVPMDPLVAEAEKRVFERWLRTVAESEQQLLSFEERFMVVEGAVRFRQAVSDVRRFLAEWVPPVVSLARGLRARALTPAEVQARHSLVRAGHG